MQNTKGSLIVVSGFSGAGKGTLMHNLIGRSDRYALSVSMTTRDPRPGERDGIEYFFATDAEFEKKIGENGFLEHARYVGHYYGTPRDYVEKKLAEGKDVILEIDAQGGEQIRHLMSNAVLVFVVTPTVEILYDRLTGRGTEASAKVAQRVEQAKKEVGIIPQYDYLIVNDDLDRCTDDLEAIIRVSHLKPAVNEELISELSEDLDKLIQSGRLYIEKD